MNAREFFGNGSLQTVREILDAERASKVLLVSGKESFSASGLADEVLPLLAGTAVARFFDFAQNPKIEDIRRGVDLVRHFSPDIVVAVGGGSVLDMAKLINGIAAQSPDCESIVTGAEPIQEMGYPLVAIPTTAGTGSEVTHFAVAYIGHAKYSVAHPTLLPKYSIVDPRLSHRMSPKLTATTGLDALCQATESYWAVQATDESRMYAEEAIQLVLASLERAVNQPTPLIRHDMARGALLAGKAINISKTTAPHALSYTLTSRFGVPHGHAVSLFLGKFFQANAAASASAVVHSLGEQFFTSIMGRLVELFGCEDPGACDHKIASVIKSVGLQSSLAELGLKTPDCIEELVSNINVERLGNHPIRLTTNDLRTLVASC